MGYVKFKSKLTDVLSIEFWPVENLVLPHVQVEDHDKEDKAIVEPFSGYLYF